MFMVIRRRVDQFPSPSRSLADTGYAAIHHVRRTAVVGVHLRRGAA